MNDMLSREQIVDLLWYLGASEVKNQGGMNIQFTCTVHKESHASAGIRVEDGVYNCFACGSSGNIPWLVHKSMPDEYPNLNAAYQFLEDRYGIDFRDLRLQNVDTKNIRRFGEVKEKKKIPVEKEYKGIFSLAPLRSGKETYKYFYDRGFTSETVESFKIGRDLKKETVTIPVFDEKEELLGVIGRYIDPNRLPNMRYNVSKGFNRAETLFPINKLDKTKGYIILVEGILDAVWLHQLGFTNTVSSLSNRVSDTQALKLREIGLPVLVLYDNDERGKFGRDEVKTSLSDLILYTTDYINGKNDPQECSKEELEQMIKSRYSLRIRPIRRI